MKNIDAYILYKNLTEGLENCKVGFPVEINSARRKNLRILRPIVEDYLTLKNELINKYGTPDENGKIAVSLENMEFREEFARLNALENNIVLCMVEERFIPTGLTPKEYDCLAELICDSSEET